MSNSNGAAAAVGGTGTGKAIVAAAVAIAGAGLLGWTVYDTYFRPEPAAKRVAAADSEEKEQNAPDQRMSAPIPVEGDRLKVGGGEWATRPPAVEMVSDANFPAVGSDADAAEVVKELSGAFASASQVIGEVSNAPVQAADQLQETTKAFLGRLMANPSQDPLEVIRALGGSTTNAQGEPIKGSVVTKLAELLTHASIDVSKAKVIKPFEMQLPPGMKGFKMPQAPGGPNPDSMVSMMSVNRSSSSDGKESGAPAGDGIHAAGDSRPSAGELVEATMTTPLTGLFPGVDSDQKIAKIEVRAPIKFKDESITGGQPTQIGLILALNPATNKWQPASLNFYAASVETLKGIGKSMRKDKEGSESKSATTPGAKS